MVFIILRAWENTTRLPIIGQLESFVKTGIVEWRKSCDPAIEPLLKWRLLSLQDQGEGWASGFLTHWVHVYQ